jgi:hypothetical protein
MQWAGAQAQGAETIIELLTAMAETWGRLKPIRGSTVHLRHGI